jgi:hypothetical protein
MYCSIVTRIASIKIKEFTSKLRASFIFLTRHQPIHAKKRRSRKQFDDVLLVMEVEDIHVGSPFAHQKSNFNILNIRRPSY